MSGGAYLALGPGCWAVGASPVAARRKALGFAGRGVALRDVGCYRLPEDATASVDGFGRVVVEGGDGTTPEHVAGPDTVDWGSRK